MHGGVRPLLLSTIASAVVIAVTCVPSFAQAQDTIALRGRTQTVHLYGVRGSGAPVIVSSGDGGWIHLGPHVAEFLAAHGYFVVGFDTKRYLESFTSTAAPLRGDDAAGDYRTLVRFAASGSAIKPILIGVSEGAGLSVLAATDPETKREISGVIGLGLPDINELGWRWADSIIYLTHGVPREPTFSAAALVQQVSPLPLADIHSTHDEFVPVSEAARTIERANAPKRLWIVEASDHRFSGNLSVLGDRLLEAIDWVRRNQPR